MVTVYLGEGRGFSLEKDRRYTDQDFVVFSKIHHNRLGVLLLSCRFFRTFVGNLQK